MSIFRLPDRCLSRQRFDRLAFEKSCDAPRGFEAAAEALLAGRAADVGSEDDVVHREESFLDEGLVFENIEGGAGEMAGLKGGDDGAFIHDFAAGDVDEIGPGFHLREPRGIDEVMRRRGQGNEREDEI